MTETSLRLSFVVPIYNDGELAEDFTRHFESSMRELTGKADIGGEIELIFVNDGSKNDSLIRLKKSCDKFPFVKLIDLSRNFGQHIALSAGYEHAAGRYVGMMNVDMEDPPSEIAKVLKPLEDGEYDIVTALRTNRNVGWAEKISSNFFHWLLGKLTETDNPVNCSTLRIMNRRFVDAYNQLKERDRYIPALESWLGFKHGYVETRQQTRTIGKSSYNFSRRLRMAIRTILSFSSLPLKAAVVLGFVISILGFLLGAGVVVTKLMHVDYQTGWASTISLITLLGGAQIAVIGVVGLYVGRILREVQNRPVYLVREKINFPKNS